MIKYSRPEPDLAYDSPERIGPSERAVARIGHGAKIHPVTRAVGRAGWIFACTCGGTNNGAAYSRMTVYRGSAWAKRTCGTR